MAEQPNQASNESEHAEIAGVSGVMDLEAVRKIKELCQRYGKEQLKELLEDMTKAA